MLTLFGYLRRDLGRQKLRTALAALGVMLGVWLVVTFAAISAGALRTAEAMLTQFGEDFHCYRFSMLWRTCRCRCSARAARRKPSARGGPSGSSRRFRSRTGRMPGLPQVSGGERQRVAVARSLANDPGLVPADEPTGSLDQENGERVLDLLVRVNREHGATVVFVTHDERVAGRAGRVIRMLDGRVLAGNPSARRPGQSGALRSGLPARVASEGSAGGSAMAGETTSSCSPSG